MNKTADRIFASHAAGTASPRADRDDVAADWDGYAPQPHLTVAAAIACGPYPISGDARLNNRPWRP